MSETTRAVPLARARKPSNPSSLAARRAARVAARIAAGKAEVVATLAKGLSPAAAATAAKVHRSTIYTWREADAAFAAAWDAAYDAGTDVIEDIALKRATVGVQKPVFQGGRQVGTVQEYSDALILATLGRRREQWRAAKTKVELSGKDGGPVLVQTVRERIARKLAALGGGSGGGST
jgi:hypothetical protein